jgi:mannose-6-phosphate isomerase
MRCSRRATSVSEANAIARPVQPEPLQPTRVHRFYRGGALLGRLRGKLEEDGFFPEDWVGSVTQARSPGRTDPEGLSRLADGRLLRDAVQAEPIVWLGAEHVATFGTSTGLHAHPDRRFAAEAFDSPFGKTEAWIVLDTRRDEADVWVGLREPVEPERYLMWIADQDVDRLLHSLNRISVRAGDVVYVPAGVPHAIGPGVLLVELQEPTDFSIVCEWDGFPVAPDDTHLGLGWETAVGALDLRAHEPVRRLPESSRSFFFADAVAAPAGRFAVLLAIAGAGALDGRPVRPGDAFAVPASSNPFDLVGDVRVLRCLAPDPR